MPDADECCARVAARQHGCVLLQQALDCGLTREGVARRSRSGRWRRLLPRVYAMGGSPETWEQRLFAAALWGGEGVAVSGPSAAALWGFPGFRRGPVEISLPRGRRARGGIVVRRTSLEPVDATLRDHLPITTPARTLADVAAGLDGRSFDTVFHYCLHSRLADLATLNEVAARRSGPGIGGLRSALDVYSDAPPAASALEARCARLLARSHLPTPTRQHEVKVADRTRRLDFAWPAARVALEVDGYRWHSSRGAWERDRARLRELRREGWTVVQATHDDLNTGFARLEAEIAALLAR